MKKQWITFLLTVMVLAIAGCGDSDDDSALYYVGVDVSGLPAGDSVVLQNNGDDDLLLSADGNATFSESQVDGSSYHVSVHTQPTDTNTLCAVMNPVGTINGAAVEVTVTCTDIVTLSGAVEDSQDGMLGGVPIEVRNAADDSVLAETVSQTAGGTGNWLPVAEGQEVMSNLTDKKSGSRRPPAPKALICHAP